MKYKQIHFVGIKGVGMTALAVLTKEAGAVVTGSDIAEQFITDKTLLQAEIIPYVGFAPEHINTAELIITTGAHGGYDNPEVVSAKEKGIRVVSLAEAIGMIMNGELFGHPLQGISVAGTHGKTTTTAMIATLFTENNLDASYFIGTSSIPSLGTSGHFGKGEYFIVESDEYATEPVHDRRPKFYWQSPQIAVFTNIDHDHSDIYPTLDSVRQVFLQFAQKLPSTGVLIACGDNHQVQRLLKEYNGRKITYGFTPDNDFVLQRVQISDDGMFFHVKGFDADLGEFFIRVSGEHNALNALAAIIVGLECGLSLENSKQALQKFSGSKRRLERKGTMSSDILIYDDYGHHPTEIAASLAALRSMYPRKKIICIFQPHTYSRTKQFFDEFTRCFRSADEVIILPIYASAREEIDHTISAEMLTQAIQKMQKDVIFLPNRADVVKYVSQKNYRGAVIVTMGAGDVYKIIDSLDIHE